MQMKIAIAQLNPVVGDISGNAKKAVQYIKKCKKDKVDVVVFPELFITGYPPSDLLFNKVFIKQALDACNNIVLPATTNICAIIGTPQFFDRKLYNVAHVIQNKRLMSVVRKTLLPNYDVFDEKRYFEPEEEKNIKPVKLYINGRKIMLGIEICEDLWDDNYDIKVTDILCERGADIIINLSASPFYADKYKERFDLAIDYVRKWNVPFIYSNLIGGQDDLVFDGHSFAVNRDGKVILECEPFKSYEDVDKIPHIVYCPDKFKEYSSSRAQYNMTTEEQIVKAHILNVRDYFDKLKIFNGIVIGLSGGLDSAYAAYIAAEAIGPEKVLGVAMPSEYSSDHSINDAKKLAENLGIEFVIVPIKDMYQAGLKTYKEVFGETEFSVAEENDQARCRMQILMKISAKRGYVVCSTGNKSEISVGYCTLYGDTAGGKNIPGDLYKSEMYKICRRYINRKTAIIPTNTIDKPPSAELRPDQKDIDSLPPYEILDKVLDDIENNVVNIESIVNYFCGFKRIGIKSDELRDDIKKVMRLYKNSEFKRDQMPRGIKVSKRAFGIGRRMPIVNGWNGL